MSFTNHVASHGGRVAKCPFYSMNRIDSHWQKLLIFLYFLSSFSEISLWLNTLQLLAISYSWVVPVIFQNTESTETTTFYEDFFLTLTSFSRTRQTSLICLVPLTLVMYLVTLQEMNCNLYNQLQWNQTNLLGLSGSTVTANRTIASYSENRHGHITSYSGTRQT